MSLTQRRASRLAMKYASNICDFKFYFNRYIEPSTQLICIIALYLRQRKISQAIESPVAGGAVSYDLRHMPCQLQLE